VAQIEKIIEIFKRRATRHEFAAASFSVYLQFAITQNEIALANELTTYAYRNIFPKLSWLTKIVTLDAAR